MNKSEIEAKPCWTGIPARNGSALLTEGNEVTLYVKGDRGFGEMHKEIAVVTRFVNVEMYIFLFDGVGRMVAGALAQKAREGVKVRVVYDAIGSSSADERMFEEMRQAGVQVEVFLPVSPWRKRSGILGRNHCKSLTIDGRVAFTGGMNLGEVWSQNYHSDAWRDTHMKVEGPAAACQNFLKSRGIRSAGNRWKNLANTRWTRPVPVGAIAWWSEGVVFANAGRSDGSIPRLLPVRRATW